MARAHDEVVKYVEEVHALLGSNAQLAADKVWGAEQLAAAEVAIQVCSSEQGNSCADWQQHAAGSRHGVGGRAGSSG